MLRLNGELVELWDQEICETTVCPEEAINIRRRFEEPSNYKEELVWETGEGYWYNFLFFWDMENVNFGQFPGLSSVCVVTGVGMT